jgi:Ser/Thr protein kinase RdoA (MazF antagonist)
LRTPIGTIDWVEKTELLDNFLDQQSILTSHPMDQGMEAEVLRISSDTESFVLKIWNKRSKPDIGFQFRLLQLLSERGLSVSTPLGWGKNADGDPILFTTFDGVPVLKSDEKKMTAVANILSSIHQMDGNELEKLDLPKYAFIGYFFPGVNDHPDINSALRSLVQRSEIKQVHLIHGDFHLGNILEKNDQYTVIDWTNGQLGDPRYDFAWSLVLKKIYLSARHADVFRSAYLLEQPIHQEELEAFEALAYLRWIYLHRKKGVPKGPQTIEKVRSLITQNRFLIDGAVSE